MKEVIQQWKDNVDTIGAGPSTKVVSRWYDEFGQDYAGLEAKYLGKE